MKKHIVSALSLSITMVGLLMVSATSASAWGSYKKVSNHYQPGVGGILSMFRNCPNPGGTLIASYDEGRHQIPGGDLMTGSDYVYRVGHNIFVQCFCPPEESGKNTGIQSNWIHEGQLSDSQEQYLLSQGWMRIDNGTQWGLPAGAYLVKNLSFRCDEHGGEPCYPHHGGDKAEVSHRQKVEVIQHNQAKIDNDIHVQVNTGGNKVDKNVGDEVIIKTGDASSKVMINQKMNVNVAEVDIEALKHEFWMNNAKVKMMQHSSFDW